jgi:hypothetical protein
VAPDLRIGTALITLGAMDDLAEWAFLIGFSLVLATGIGWLKMWTLTWPPTSPATERQARLAMRLTPFFLIAGIALMVVGGIGFLAQHL